MASLGKLNAKSQYLILLVGKKKGAIVRLGGVSANAQAILKHLEELEPLCKWIPSTNEEQKKLVTVTCCTIFVALYHCNLESIFIVMIIDLNCRVQSRQCTGIFHGALMKTQCFWLAFPDMVWETGNR